MKKLTTIFAIAALAFAFTSAPASACEGSKASCSASKNSKTSASYSCSKGTSATTASADSKEACNTASKNCPLANGTFSVASYNVEGMTCGGCESGLTSKFEAADGVVMVPNISFADGSAKVIFDPTITNVDALTKVISEAGFKGSIMPAVAVSGDSNAKTGAHASCSTAKTANASGKTCTASAKGAKGTTVASAGCSTACSQLTAVERESFCSKFCKSDKSSNKKGTDI